MAKQPRTGRVNAWFLARLTRQDTLLLTQRNVYILPSRAGLAPECESPLSSAGFAGVLQARALRRQTE